MDIRTMPTKVLEQSVKELEHAKSYRSGGLLLGEQIALSNMKAELERRADEAYCKAHDC